MTRFVRGVDSCREDIDSADQAVAAVATLLHQVAPEGDLTATLHKLAQVHFLCLCMSAKRQGMKAAEVVLQHVAIVHCQLVYMGR